MGFEGLGFGFASLGFEDLGFEGPLFFVLWFVPGLCCFAAERTNIGALIIRIGFWGPLYYSYIKEPPKQ